MSSLLPTGERLHPRTRELAKRAGGRPPPHVSQLDYEQPERDLTGESELDQQNAVIALIKAVAAATAVNSTREAGFFADRIDR